MKTKQDKKILIKFIVTIIISAMIGGVFGFLSSRFDVNIAQMAEMLMQNFIRFSVPLLGLCYIFIGIVIVKYNKAKAYASKATQEDEQAYELADYYFEGVLSYTNYATIACFTAFGFLASGFSYASFDLDNLMQIGIGVILFVGLLAICTTYQVLAINQIKKLYPEKKGNALDVKFQKQWFDSCDEAEKALIGKAAYKSYTVLTKAFLVFFLAVLIFSTAVPVGPLPILIVGSLWFIQTFSYLQAAKSNPFKK